MGGRNYAAVEYVARALGTLSLQANGCGRVHGLESGQCGYHVRGETHTGWRMTNGMVAGKGELW
jgi:hypothetical protein